MKVKILVSIVLALALIGAVDARGSFSSSSRSSSSFSSRSYSSTPSRSYAPSVARPSTASPTFNRPASGPSSSGTPPRIQSGTASSGSFAGRPSVTAPSTSSSWGWGRTRTVSPSGVTVIHEHHYFGGGYGGGRGYYGGYSGGFGSSPFFWLWLLDRPQQQTVYVQGQPGYTGSAGPTVAGAPIVEHDSPGFFSQLFNILIGLLMIGVIVALIVWIVRKLIGINKADHTV